MCCTESYCTCWDKGVKHASPSAKGFSGYICCNCASSKEYLVYVPFRRTIVSFYDVVFDHILTGTLTYMSHPYSEVMDMQPAISYIPYYIF